MQTLQEIYQAASRLPYQERLKLAAMILQDLTEQSSRENRREKIFAIDLLEKMPPRRLFKTSEEVDEYLREERESWER